MSDPACGIGCTFTSIMNVIGWTMQTENGTSVDEDWADEHSPLPSVLELTEREFRQADALQLPESEKQALLHQLEVAPEALIGWQVRISSTVGSCLETC